MEILRFVADLPSELHSRFEEYFITFNRQQGIGGTNHIQLILNQPIPSPIEPPRRDDAKFLGYFDHTDSPSAKRYYNADGTRAYGEPWEMRNGITLYARWEPYPILTFDWNFGNAPETEDRRTNERGFLIGSPPIVNDNMNPGHTFNGWFRTQVGGNPIDFSTHTFNRDTTLYAQWEPIPGWCDHDYNGFGVCKRSMSCGH
ncbi:MAG: InlB B-repeat-containing protein, partial [Oscillospiraceae bacterium]|nr:InlB B-repeat-containing protein [Oscillospiraceae bacterium]